MLLTLEFICVSAPIPSYNYSHFMSWIGNKQIYDRIENLYFASKNYHGMTSDLGMFSFVYVAVSRLY